MTTSEPNSTDVAIYARHLLTQSGKPKGAYFVTRTTIDQGGDYVTVVFRSEESFNRERLAALGELSALADLTKVDEPNTYGDSP